MVERGNLQQVTTLRDKRACGHMQLAVIPRWLKRRAQFARSELCGQLIALAWTMRVALRSLACAWIEIGIRFSRPEGFPKGSSKMCDYSLHTVHSRPAKVGDKLRTRDFGTGTRGFAASENPTVAVCVRPGTELAFEREVAYGESGWFKCSDQVANYRTAIFRQVNHDKAYVHRDALEFPDGEVVLLTHLYEGQDATVLQLPADATAAAEPSEPTTEPRPSVVG